MNSDSAAITAICGSANSITGLSQAVSDRPEPNQITISESRQLRVSVSSTEMNMVSDSSTGSAPSAKKPRKATTASDGNLAAGGLAEQPDQPRGERDREQRHEHRARETGEFPEQRAVEDHAILSARGI